MFAFINIVKISTLVEKYLSFIDIVKNCSPVLILLKMWAFVNEIKNLSCTNMVNFMTNIQKHLPLSMLSKKCWPLLTL